MKTKEEERTEFTPVITPSTLKLTFTQRASMTRNPMVRRILQIMDKKRSNLCLSADVTTKAEVGYNVHIMRTLLS
jgi:hypothetical protein